jgi:hypothetical protein
MGSQRILLAVALASLTLAGAAAAWTWMRPPPGDSGRFHVEVIGPHGPLVNATVRVDNATALTALTVAASSAGLEVLTREYPGMGAYVYSIGGFTAHGGSGWIYEVHKDGPWRSGDRSPADAPLHEGEGLRWRWVDAWSG